MSSIAASASTSSTSESASVSPTDLSPPASPVLSSQAALYLYTFLVTLILLLTISSAIVLRSLVLRRRHRRMIEEAIRNGTYVPPIRTPRGLAALGARPVLHDVFLSIPDPYEDDPGDEGECESEDGKTGVRWWGGITPVAAWLDSDERSCATGLGVLRPGGMPLPDAPRLPSLHLSLRWMSSRLRRVLHMEDPDGGGLLEPRTSLPLAHLPPPPSTTNSTLNSNSPLSPPLSSKFAAGSASASGPTANSHLLPRAHVAVLIRMPAPPEHKKPKAPPQHEREHGHQRQSTFTSASTATAAALDVDVDADLPVVEFGIATVPFNDSDRDGGGGGGGEERESGKGRSAGSDGGSV